jgi:hypothetical protein
MLGQVPPPEHLSNTQIDLDNQQTDRVRYLSVLGRKALGTLVHLEKSACRELRDIGMPPRVLAMLMPGLSLVISIRPDSGSGVSLTQFQCFDFGLEGGHVRVMVIGGIVVSSDLAVLLILIPCFDSDVYPFTLHCFVSVH